MHFQNKIFSLTVCKNANELFEKIGWEGINLQSRKKLLTKI